MIQYILHVRTRDRANGSGIEKEVAAYAGGADAGFLGFRCLGRSSRRVGELERLLGHGFLGRHGDDERHVSSRLVWRGRRRACV